MPRKRMSRTVLVLRHDSAIGLGNLGPTLEVEPTEAGSGSPVRHFAGVPTVQWHGDSFELPAGVEHLATSPQYENQAFGIGDWLLAVQPQPVRASTG
jgi:GMP synthase-like glutamine amidotransferase